MSVFLSRGLAVQSNTPEGRIGCLTRDPEQVLSRVLACWSCLDLCLWLCVVTTVGMVSLFLLVLLATLKRSTTTNAV
jgi:hypothetical protein